MGNEQKITTDKAWKILFTRHDIVSRVSANGFLKPFSFCFRVPILSGSNRPPTAPVRRISTARRRQSFYPHCEGVYLRLPSSPALPYPVSATVVESSRAYFPRYTRPLPGQYLIRPFRHAFFRPPRFNLDCMPISKSLRQTPPLTPMFTPIDGRVGRRSIVYPYMPPPFRRQSLT
jgi:hypothetical protein